MAPMTSIGQPISDVSRLGYEVDKRDVVPCVALTDPRLIEVGIDPHTLYGKGITEDELQVLLQKKRERDLSAAAKAKKSDAPTIGRRK